MVVVNHAIYETNDASIDSMSLEQWNNTLAVNLTGVFLYVREVCIPVELPFQMLTACSL